MTGGSSFAQQQVLVGLSLLVGDVLYKRAHGSGIQIH